MVENTHGEAGCRFCGAALKNTLVDLGVTPLCQTHISRDQLNNMEPFYPLHVRVCGECLLVQLDEYVAPTDIFEEYAYFSSFSESWLKHAEVYSDMAQRRFVLTENSFVVEIASNDGYLLRNFVNNGIPCLGVEPAANVAAAAREIGVPTVSRFFGVQTADDIRQRYGSADLIVGNNVLAHVPDLNDFVAGMVVLLSDQGTITMEFPHLMRLMDEVQFDTIYHEHFSYFSFLTVSQVFRKHGLTIVDVEQLPTHGGSLRIFAMRSQFAFKPSGHVEALFEAERSRRLDRLETYSEFQDRVNAVKWDLLDFLISARRDGKQLVGYGAPGKGNTLLNYCGIGVDFLDYTVDRNPYKQGKFTPGSRIPILSPEKIQETRPDYILILPWNLKDEIVGGNGYVREWGGKFVIPIPALEVIS